MVDATHQGSNSLDVNENNRDGFDFSLSEKISVELQIIKDKQEKVLPKIKQIQDDFNLLLANFEKEHDVWVLIEKKEGRIDLGLLVNPDSPRG